jgi:hypothetical protein
MTQQKITKSNNLIAEFMGLIFILHSHGTDKHGEYEVPSRWIENGKVGYKTELLYHSSWDWLMPVIEKICHHEFDDKTCCYLRTFGMKDEQNQFMVRFNRYGLCYGTTLIEATYEAVLEFVKDYHESR